VQNFKNLSQSARFSQIASPLGWKKLDLNIFTPVILKSRSNQKWLNQLVHTGQMHLLCKFGDRTSVTCRDNTHIKVSQGDLVLLCDQGSLVGLCIQDYKSLCATITICATLVNTQTDYLPAYTNNSPTELKTFAKKPK